MQNLALILQICSHPRGLSSLCHAVQESCPTTALHSLTKENPQGSSISAETDGLVVVCDAKPVSPIIFDLS